MTLTGELKTQVENTNTKEEVKEVLEKEGIELTDEELDQVAGGFHPSIPIQRLIEKIKEKFKK